MLYLSDPRRSTVSRVFWSWNVASPTVHKSYGFLVLYCELRFFRGEFEIQEGVAPWSLFSEIQVAN